MEKISTLNRCTFCILFNNYLEYNIVNMKKDGKGNFILLDLIIEEELFL